MIYTAARNSECSDTSAQDFTDKILAESDRCLHLAGSWSPGLAQDARDIIKWGLEDSRDTWRILREMYDGDTPACLSEDDECFDLIEAVLKIKLGSTGANGNTQELKRSPRQSKMSSQG